jgi:hypothetical protein
MQSKENVVNDFYCPSILTFTGQFKRLLFGGKIGVTRTRFGPLGNTNRSDWRPIASSTVVFSSE